MSRKLEITPEEKISFFLQKIDECGNTLLHYVVETGNMDFAAQLIAAGCDVNARNAKGYPSMACTVCQESSDMNFIKDKIFTLLNNADEDGNILLHYVVKTKNEMLAKELIVNGSDINSKNQSKHPPIWYAIRERHVEMVRILLEEGASHFNFKFKDLYGPLHFAAECGWPEIVELLIKNGANVSSRDRNGKSPLHIAWEAKSEDKFDDYCKIIKYLMEAGASPHARDNKDTVLLYEFGKFDNLNKFKRIIELCFDINMTYIDGNSCLHHAALHLNHQLVQLFLNCGAAVDKVNETGFNAMCCMIDNYDKWLDGGMSLHYYFSTRPKYKIKRPNSEYFIRLMNCLEILVKYGSNVNHITKNELTPLYIVLQNCIIHNTVVRFLLENGATFDFEHPIIHNVMKNPSRIDYSSALLEHQAMIEARNLSNGPTNFDANKLTTELQEYYALCKDELKLMKTTMFNDTNVSFFNLLVNRDIGPFARSKNITPSFKTPSTAMNLFPVYGCLLIKRFSAELEFQGLLKKAGESLGYILDWDVNSLHIPVYNILCYLDKKDLNNLALLLH